MPKIFIIADISSPQNTDFYSTFCRKGHYPKKAGNMHKVVKKLMTFGRFTPSKSWGGGALSNKILQVAVTIKPFTMGVDCPDLGR